MKLLIAIFEGADFDVLNDFILNGNLPNFKSLHDIYRLKCDCIPYEAAGLMSAFTGIPERNHGISSYWKSQNYFYTPELWNSSDVKDSMIWNQPYMKNIKTVLINLWGTHPVYPVNGYMISYSMEKSLRYTYPPELCKELLMKNINCVQDTCVLYNENVLKKEFCNNVRKIDRLRHAAVSHFIDNCDLLIVNYTSIDRISHFYFNEYLNIGIMSELYSAYEQCDSILGDLIAFTEQYNSDLIVFSEIGFGKLEKFININDELLKADLLQYKDCNGIVNWEKTYAFESVQGSHGININKRNNFKNGIVNESEYNKKVEMIIDFLKSMINNETGRPLFKRVLRRSEYYSGAENTPDIILDPYDQKYLPYGDSYWANFLTRHAQTGWHRSNGIISLISKRHTSMRDLYVHELFEIFKQHFCQE